MKNISFLGFLILSLCAVSSGAYAQVGASTTEHDVGTLSAPPPVPQIQQNQSVAAPSTAPANPQGVTSTPPAPTSNQ